MTHPTLDNSRIREAAYLLWLDEGRPQGRDREHWLRAIDALSPATPKAHPTKAPAKPRAAKPKPAPTAPAAKVAKDAAPVAKPARAKAKPAATKTTRTGKPAKTPAA